MDSELQETLNALKQSHLNRRLREVESSQSINLLMEGTPIVNFSSNDYLGLANHLKLRDAAKRAIDTYGVGSGSARLICGSLKPHQDLEIALAQFKGTARALVFASGYSAALGTISALMGKQDTIVLDKLAHACLVDAARLSGARLRVFPHNNLNRLEAILQHERASASEADKRILIVTESIFSMDGDASPLQDLTELKHRYGAWLMVDEAHATGLYGDRGQGLIAELGLTDEVEIQMGTLGKALGSAGGFIAGSSTLIDFLVNKARSFLFSTAPLPAASAAAMVALEIVQSEEGMQLRKALWYNRRKLEALSNSSTQDRSVPSAILPWMVGEENEALQCSQQLWDVGFLVPAIRYPTVPKGKARLRITVNANHQPHQIDALTNHINKAKSDFNQKSPSGSSR